jgi:hypothetical protein
MSHPSCGPVNNGEHFQAAVQDLYGVLHFLEAPYELSAKDWQEAYDGLGRVVLAVERLSATLVARCPATDHAAELSVVHDLLRDASTRLTRTEPLPG